MIFSRAQNDRLEDQTSSDFSVFFSETSTFALVREHDGIFFDPRHRWLTIAVMDTTCAIFQSRASNPAETRKIYRFFFS